MAAVTHIEDFDLWRGLRRASHDLGRDATDMWANRATFRRVLENVPIFHLPPTGLTPSMMLFGMRMVYNEFLPTDEIHLLRRQAGYELRAGWNYNEVKHSCLDSYQTVKILKLLPERDLSWVELSEGRWK